uniref:Bm14436 n=1 Tax=Brugia malayi TaxID=6279 RepID=A0A1I9G5R8_BRUMA|nr:Bm14436 [Brugia malayi]
MTIITEKKKTGNSLVKNNESYDYYGFYLTPAGPASASSSSPATPHSSLDSTSSSSTSSTASLLRSSRVEPEKDKTHQQIYIHYHCE